MFVVYLLQPANYLVLTSFTTLQRLRYIILADKGYTGKHNSFLKIK